MVTNDFYIFVCDHQNPCLTRNTYFIKKYIYDHYNSYMTFKETKFIWPLYFTNDHKNKEKIWKICATIESCKWPWKKVNAEKEIKISDCNHTWLIQNNIRVPYIDRLSDASFWTNLSTTQLQLDINARLLQNMSWFINPLYPILNTPPPYNFFFLPPYLDFTLLKKIMWVR